MDRALCNRSDNLNDLDYLRTCENHLENALCIFEENKQPNAMHVAGQLVTTEGNAHICSAHRNRFTHLPNHATGTAVYVVYERYF